MSRIIGLDYGTKRTGIAVTDPLRLIATPLKSIPSHQVLPFLKDYIACEEVGIIVVGWPLKLDGTLGSTALLVEQFIRLLARHFPTTPIRTYDERFTSLIAQRSLIERGVKKKKRRNSAVDAISASLILTSFMEHQHLTAQRTHEHA